MRSAQPSVSVFESRNVNGHGEVAKQGGLRERAMDGLAAHHQDLVMAEHRTGGADHVVELLPPHGAALCRRMIALRSLGLRTPAKTVMWRIQMASSVSAVMRAQRSSGGSDSHACQRSKSPANCGCWRASRLAFALALATTGSGPALRSFATCTWKRQAQPVLTGQRRRSPRLPSTFRTGLPSLRGRSGRGHQRCPFRSAFLVHAVRRAGRQPEHCPERPSATPCAARMAWRHAHDIRRLSGAVAVHRSIRIQGSGRPQLDPVGTSNVTRRG